MKPSEAFAEWEAAKAAFASAITRALQQVPAAQSATFTGSFVDKPGLAGISDIDLVVVVDALTEASFAACRAAVAGVPPSILGLPDHRLVINDTFGPLKFDEPGVVVVHLMVYDVASHREHVLKSPFTCLDWERSPFHAGPPLRAIYPVVGLQPRQFFAARRSLHDYLQDITAGTISYRRHHFDGLARSEVVERHPLDRRHQGEYAYHIVRNLVANYAKLVRHENCRWSEAELIEFWRRHLPGCECFIDWFIALAAVKHARGRDFPSDTADHTRKFLAAFGEELEHHWTRRAVRHCFVRHAATALNDGSFLGQRRDPPITIIPSALPGAPREVFTSPSLRCRQTAAALAPLVVARADARLLELDYGQAEGLDFAGLAQAHPEIPAAWQRGADPAFPGGENTGAVAARLRAFLDELPAEPSLVVTHNVVLRCLLGSCLGLPLRCWHRIPVNHLECFEVLRFGDAFYLDLTDGQVARISDALAGHLA